LDVLGRLDIGTDCTDPRSQDDSSYAPSIEPPLATAGSAQIEFRALFPPEQRPADRREKFTASRVIFEAPDGGNAQEKLS
jgi:hypothetical protein